MKNYEDYRYNINRKIETDLESTGRNLNYKADNESSVHVLSTAQLDSLAYERNTQWLESKPIPLN